MGPSLVEERALGGKGAAVVAAMEGQRRERGIEKSSWAGWEKEKKWRPAFSGAKGHCLIFTESD